MLKKILLALFAILVGLYMYALTRPNDFRYERSVVINAPAERIFPLINNLREAGHWSPWEKLDPNMKRDFSHQFQGVGATYAWDGNSKVGKGNLKITESVPNKRVVEELHFERPMKATNTAEFVLEPQKGGSTKVTWAMYGPNTFMGKVMGLFMDCKKMIETTFDEGLANLKERVETQKIGPTGTNDEIPDWARNHQPPPPGYLEEWRKKNRERAEQAVQKMHHQDAVPAGEAAPSSDKTD